MGKVLVSGDVRGKLSSLFDRVNKINNSKAGPFDCVFCVGTFFNEDDTDINAYLNGEKDVPLPTYFITGEEKSTYASKLFRDYPEGSELCRNLFYLGHHGVKTIKNLRVAYLSGTSNPDSNDLLSNYDANDIKFILNDINNENVDILLTCEWGTGFHNLLQTQKYPEQYKTIDSNTLSTLGSLLVASLASQVSCKYHFAGMQDVYYQLPPYKISTTSVATRFYGMATLGGKGGRCMSAFKVDPTSNGVKEATWTQCPYTSTPIYTGNSVKRKVPDSGLNSNESVMKKSITETEGEKEGDNTTSSSSSSNFRYNIIDKTDNNNRIPPEGYICNKCKQEGHYIKQCPLILQQYICNKCKQTGHFFQDCPLYKSKDTPPSGYVCNICQIPGHYIKNCPQAIEKNNNKPQAECWFCLGSSQVAEHLIISIGEECYVAMAKGYLSSSHVLILPVGHVSSSIELSVEANNELIKYKQSLRAMAESNNQYIVFVERTLPSKTPQHLFIECIPYDKNDHNISTSENIFIEEFKKNNLSYIYMNDDVSLSEIVNDHSYVHIDLPNGKQLVHIVTDSQASRGAFNIGRDGMSKILGCPDKANWRQCQHTDDEETKATEEFKLKYTSFDPAQ